ncbi:hypothetical protein [Pseudoglutamicibacter albus]|uniref:hypothetical protein n=1 Tax=Pseudoglutamicibacter albus TaxID=98671 RepID=UPI003607A9B4
MTSLISPSHNASCNTGSRGWRIVLMSVLSVVLATVLAGCGSIPTAGPVGTLEPSERSGGEQSYTFDVPGPSPGIHQKPS